MISNVTVQRTVPTQSLTSRRVFLPCFGLLLTLPGLVSAQPRVASTFDTGTEGWTYGMFDGIPGSICAGPLVPGFASNGGNPGGAILADDLNTCLLAWIAPISFLGDLTDVMGGTFSFDLRDVSIDGTCGQGLRVVLSGGSPNLILVHSRSDLSIADGNWHHLDVPMCATSWVNQATGFAATPAEFATALASVDTLLIRGEYICGANNETMFLDNPTLWRLVTQSPESTTFCPGSSTGLIVVASGTGPLTYSWRKGGVNLTDGPTGSGSTLGGANTTQLTLTNAQPSDAGFYDCVVSDAGCAVQASATATMTVGGCVPAVAGWGLVVLALVTLGCGTIIMHGRAAAPSLASR